MLGILDVAWFGTRLETILTMPKVIVLPMAETGFCPQMYILLFFHSNRSFSWTRGDTTKHYGVFCLFLNHFEISFTHHTFDRSSALLLTVSSPPAALSQCGGERLFPLGTCTWPFNLLRDGRGTTAQAVRNPFTLRIGTRPFRNEKRTLPSFPLSQRRLVRCPVSTDV